MSKIALAEMVEELRSELRAAVAQGEGQELRFEVQEITLELKVELTKEGGAEGKVKFWVFTEASAYGNVAASNVQTVTLKLVPKGASGDVLLLSQ
jgi:Trypsin-co-occurring domain 2